jgi:hypothetical protein
MTPKEMIIQCGRQRPGHQVSWRSIARVSARTAAQAQRGVELIYGVDPTTKWRVVDAADPMHVLAQWDGFSWAV